MFLAVGYTEIVSNNSLSTVILVLTILLAVMFFSIFYSRIISSITALILMVYSIFLAVNPTVNVAVIGNSTDLTVLTESLPFTPYLQIFLILFCCLIIFVSTQEI